MTFIIYFGLGLIVGSFLNAVIYRLHSGESFMKGRSHCAVCGHELAAIDLVPVLSYLALRGHCRYCKKKISWQYPAIELLTAIIFALLAAHANWNLTSILISQLIFACIFIVVAVFDLKHYLILDKVIFPAMGLALAFALYWDIQTSCGLAWSCHTVGGLVAAVLVAGFFLMQYLISRGRWIGFGDVKLGLLLGLVLGLPLALVGLFLAYLVGAVTGVGLILAGHKTMSSRLPFGTFLCFSAILTILYGHPVLDWYLRLLGF